jgi:hypothetical protein
MNENDLSDYGRNAAYTQWCATPIESGHSPGKAWNFAWEEARRRAEANPWQFFGKSDLDHLLSTAIEPRCAGCRRMEKGIRAELARRKGQQ